MWFLTDTLLNPPDQNRQNVRRKRKVCRLQPAFFGGHSHFLPLPAWPGCMHVRGRGRRAFKQSVSPSAVDGGRDAQLGRRWFEVSGEKERDPKNLAAWPFCLAWCACCSLFRSLILVRLHRQTRTHARHAQRRQMAGRQGTLADWAESGNEPPVSGPCARDAGDSCRRAANHRPVPCGGAWRGGLPSLGIGWS